MKVPLHVICVAGVSIAALFACEKRAAPETTPAAQRTPPPRGPTGSIEGRILFEGPAPVPARMPTNDSVARHCGAELDDDSLVIGSGGGVRFAVVSADGLPASTTDLPPGAVVVDQLRCQFLPSIFGARAGATIEMKNSDPLTHNVRAQQSGRDLYNVAMPLTGMVIKKVLPNEPGIVRLVCDIHPWMNARIKTFDHPHFTSTDAEGRFRLEGIPTGKRSVSVWHPRLGERSTEVDGGARSITTTVRFTAADVRPLE